MLLPPPDRLFGSAVLHDGSESMESAKDASHKARIAPLSHYSGSSTSWLQLHENHLINRLKSSVATASASCCSATLIATIAT
jgi:hypothetical protein